MVKQRAGLGKDTPALSQGFGFWTDSAALPAPSSRSPAISGSFAALNPEAFAQPPPLHEQDL